MAMDTNIEEEEFANWKYQIKEYLEKGYVTLEEVKKELDENDFEELIKFLKTQSTSI